MSQKDDRATRIAHLLDIKYTHAVRLIRRVMDSSNADFTFSDLAHACRELKEKEEAKARGNSCDGCRTIERMRSQVPPGDEAAFYEFRRAARHHRNECPNR